MSQQSIPQIPDTAERNSGQSCPKNDSEARHPLPYAKLCPQQFGAKQQQNPPDKGAGGWLGEEGDAQHKTRQKRVLPPRLCFSQPGPQKEGGRQRETEGQRGFQIANDSPLADQRMQAP